MYCEVITGQIAPLDFYSAGNSIYIKKAIVWVIILEHWIHPTQQRIIHYDISSLANIMVPTYCIDNIKALQAQSVHKYVQLTLNMLTQWMLNNGLELMASLIAVWFTAIQLGVNKT